MLAIAAAQMLLPHAAGAAPGSAQPDPQPPPAASGSIGLTYKLDFLHTTLSNADRRSTVLGNVDLKAGYTRSDAGSGNTTRLLGHLLNNHGGKPNNHIAAAQGIDNIEVATNTTKLFQAWVEQGFFGDRLRVLAGLLDLNAEFYATDSSALFLHPTFGTGAELAQTGKNGPSIFPTSSLALRARLAQEPWYVQAAAFDGVPGDPDNPRGTHVRFRAGDGALLIVEAGRSLADEGLPGKLALGAWRYTVRADDVLDTDAQGNPVKRRDAGAYMLFDYPVVRWDEVRGVNVFGRGGIANADVNQFRRAANFGVTVRGPVASRPRDAFGIGVAAERNGAKFRQAMRLAGRPAPSSELSVEVIYRAVLAEWLAVQPSVQFLRNHGDPALASASVIGVRIELTF